MLPQWTVKTDYLLATLQERVTVSIPLPLASTNGITTSLISGELPRGLRLSDNAIVGTPLEVKITSQYFFVIRASSADGILDRTFKIIIEGADNPIWITEEGILPVGPNNLFFILDNSVIDYQLLATDNDLPAGDQLEYYIQDGDGELPLGIELTPSGKLTGIVDPILALDFNIVNSGYDTSAYSSVPYDFSIPSGSGIDTFFYDSKPYDYSVPTRVPRKLNRYYEFYVTVADSVSSVKRRFQIYVVGDDFVRADNTLMKAADGVFTADATYLRVPLWLTPSNLGLKRANNYITIYLDTIDQNYVAGEILYVLEDINDDNSPSTLPPGMVLDQNTGEIAGRVPYQPAVTKEYKFTINAIRFNAEQGFVTVFATFNKDILSGNSIVRIAKLNVSLIDGLDDINSLVGKIIPIQNRYYTIISVNSSNPLYDELLLDKPLDPILSITPLTVVKLATAGSNYFFVSSLNTNESNFYENKTISFSSITNHKIENVYPYVEYIISIEDSTGNIELNTGITGDNGFGVVSNLIDFLSIPDYDAYVTSVNGIAGIIELSLIIPSTAQNRNINFIKSLFHTSDSSAIIVNLINSFDRIKIDNTLINPLFVDRQISFGVVEGDFFKKTFPRAELDIVEKKKTFTLNILGEVDSTITWLTDSDLGTLNANRISNLFVRAETTVFDSLIKYSIVSGNLPPGLELKGNGEIVGKTPIYAVGNSLGLTFFDSNNLIFDGGDTTIDRLYKFTVLARDRFGVSATTREFFIKIDDEDSLLYSNIYIKPMLNRTQRNLFENFITDATTIPPKLVYRPSDPNFGIQTELRSLIYAGIQTKNIQTFISAAKINTKAKRYYFGSLKTAVAKKEGTNEVIYEVVYIELIDPAKPANGKTRKVFNTVSSKKITVDSVKLEANNDQFPNATGNVWRYRPVSETITIDNTAILSSQSTDSRKYISNIDNMRDRIKETGISSRDFLPLWMRTPQGDGLADLDYVFAIPLVYTLPGQSETVKQNIINANFNFRQLDYFIDRYIIDTTLNNSNEQYIIFGNYSYNV